jgi:YjbE family integral membrane protein
MWEWLQLDLVALTNVIIIDVVLAGDNAVMVGLAASRVSPQLRSRVIFWGIAGAVVLRLLFAVIAAQLLAIIGLLLAGGILLLWVCWKMYREIRHGGHEERDAKEAIAAAGEPATPMRFRAALTQIILADVTMSLDNVLAVAGAAKGSPGVLVIGLAVAIILMAIASRFIADLLARYPWISWIGLAIVLWVAVDMIYDGTQQVVCELSSGGWCEKDLLSLLHKVLTGR